MNLSEHTDLQPRYYEEFRVSTNDVALRSFAAWRVRKGGKEATLADFQNRTKVLSPFVHTVR